MVNKVVWCPMTVFPFNFGFCPNEEAWDREMKRLGCRHEYPDAMGMCSRFMRDREQCAIVTVGEGYSYDSIVSILVHESVHIYQCMINQVHEANAGDETMAYTIQFIFNQLFLAFVKTRGVPDPLRDF